VPIEIREIVIRTTVGTPPTASEPVPAQTPEERQALIQECVDQVMAILKESAER
jgi:hypothetical protein